MLSMRNPPGQMKEPAGWRIATLLLACTMLCPVAMFLAVLSVSLRLAFGILGTGEGGGGGGGLLHFLLLKDLLPGGEHAKIPVYNYVVQEGTQRISVRQEDDFVDGTIEVGDEVRLSGHLRGNTLVVRSGLNLTNGSHLTKRRNLWKGAFVTLLGLLLLGLFAMVSSTLALQ